ncbi:MAG: hypothetical protein ABH859_00085 [Pseudomonadota bacterium]
MNRSKILLGVGILMIAIAIFVWPRLDEWFNQDKMVITSKGVGTFQLGKSIPTQYLSDINKLQVQYIYGFYADGQLYEGFVFLNPPLKVAVQNGPFLKWDQAHKVFKEPAADQLKADLLNFSVAELKVKFVVIESPDLETAKGIGVGSSLAEIKQAYGQVQANPVPPTFGGDEYAVRPLALGQVVFYFENQQSAQTDGKVKRIMIFNQSS